MNDNDLDQLLVDTLHRHAAGALPLPGDPATRVAERARRRRRRILAAVAAPVAVAAAVAAFTLLGPFHTGLVAPLPPATHAPTTPTATDAPTPTATATGRPALDRPVPPAGLARLRAAVRQLTQPAPGMPTALRARLVHYQVDSWHSPDDFTLFVTLDLQFPPDAAVAWDQGTNARFVHFTKTPSGTFQLAWATSP
jgi:hypothetical protein